MSRNLIRDHVAVATLTVSLTALLIGTRPLAAQTVNVTTPGSLTAATGTTAPASNAIWNLQSTGIFLNTAVTMPTGTPGLTVNGNGNTLTLNDGSGNFGLFSNTVSGAAVTLNLSDITLTGGAGSFGFGGVISNGVGGVTTINTTGNVSLSGNTASTGSGGTIYSGSSDVNISHGNGGAITLSNNIAGQGGGAIFAFGSVNIGTGAGGTITLSGNTGGLDGGAIYAGTGGVSISTGDNGAIALTNNTAARIGGAIDAVTGNVNISTGAGGTITLSGNTASSSFGGAIFGGGDVNINTGAGGTVTLSNNTAGNRGGAIYAQANVTLNAAGGNITFSGNTQTTGANAISMQNTGGGATLTLNASGNAAISFFDPIENNASFGLVTVNKTGTGVAVFDGSLYADPVDRWSRVYGTTTVQAGTFEVRNNAVYGVLAVTDVFQTAPSSFTVDSGAILAGGIAGEVRANNFALNGILNIAGAAPAGSASGGFSNFTVTSSNVSFGAGSQVQFNTYLNDASVQRSDLLTLNLNGSATSGTANIFVTNVGGPGGLTTGNGIQLVQANNGTTAGAFTLGNAELRAGAFDYRLFQGGVDGSDPENWYLRSTEGAGPPVTPPEVLPSTPPTGPGTFPIIGPEIATYGVVQPMAQQLGRAMLGTHDERLGDLYQVPCGPAETNAPPYTKVPVYTKAPTDCGGWRPAVWGRLFGQQIDNHYQAFADPRADGQIAGFQAGVDVLRSDSLIPGHTDYAGFYAAYGNANVDISGLVSNAAATAFVLQHTGHFNLNAYSGGAYWTHYGVPGWYVDLTLQGTSYNGGASTEFAALKTTGSGFISSIEGGYPIALPLLGPGFVLEPQAQILWQWIGFDAGNDGLGPVALGTTSETTARVGLKGKWTITTDSGQVWQPYVRTNVWSDFGGTATTMFGVGSVPLISHAQYMDVDAGFTTKINTHLSAFAEAGYQFAVSNDGGGQRNGVKGTAGLRYQW